MIKIKGINGNLVIIFAEGLFDDYKEYLHKRITANIELFKGSKVLFRGEGLNDLTPQELVELQKICLDYGMVLNNTTVSVEKGQDKDLFVYRNVRSGQKLRSEGSLIIWGDVHESAEIAAAADIIVLGKLEGIVHAGCYGNRDSTVFALSLTPGQIRIADKFSRAPAPPNSNRKYIPEIAYFDGDNICISEYNPKENRPK